MLHGVARIVLWPFSPGASYAEGGFKIALWSSVLSLFYLFAAEYQFPGGASDFTTYADVLLKGGVLPTLATRDLGYPLLLLLGGYGVTQSFIGVLAVHVLLAWSMPVVAYATFGREYRHIGYYTAAAVALSMTPYLYLKFIHHDLAYMAFSILSLWLLVEYLHRGKVAALYGFLVALIATCLTRPAGNLLFLPLLALAWVIRPAQWRHYLIVGMIFAAVLAAYGMHRHRVLGATPEGNLPSYFGQQIYYNLYINSSTYGIAITPALGPATARLFEAVRRDLTQYPLDSVHKQDWYQGHGMSPQSKEFWFTRYAGEEERFVSSLFLHPNADRFEYLCSVERNDHVFRKAALEVVRAYPLYPFRYGLRNLALFLWNPGVSHGRYGLEHDSFVRERFYFLPGGRSVAEVETESAIAPPARYELRQAGSAQLRPLLSRIERSWKSEKYRKYNRVAVVLAGVALLAAIFVGGRFRWIVLVTALTLLYNAAITAAFVDPNYRYHFFVFPMVVVLAGAGVIALLRGLLRLTGKIPAFDVNVRLGNPAVDAFLHLTGKVPALRGTPVAAALRRWAVEAPPVTDPPGLAWKKAVGLALCAAAVFAAWAMMTWQAAHS